MTGQAADGVADYEVMPVRVGLIGCGRAAERIYLPAFARVPAARLAAVADPSAERRRIVAEAGGVPGFTAADEMLSATELDAIIVATPPETHRPLVEEALARRLAVLVEKPLASTLADAQSVARAAEQARSPLLVGFNRRRLPAAERLCEVVHGLLHDEEHDLPRPTGEAEILIDSEFHALPAAWDPVAGARDPLDDLASHHLDLFRFLTGAEIEDIDARRLDSGAVELEMRLGRRSRAVCTVSQGVASRERVTVRRAGPADGTRRAWMLRPSSDRLSPAGGGRRTALDRWAALSRRLRGEPDPMAGSFAAQLEALVACARGTQAPSPDVTDGLAVVEAVAAAKQGLQG